MSFSNTYQSKVHLFPHGDKVLEPESVMFVKELLCLLGQLFQVVLQAHADAL